ncbi:MAG: alpha/beta hydrolase [Azospirillaceae bacterium]
MSADAPARAAEAIEPGVADPDTGPGGTLAAGFRRILAARRVAGPSRIADLRADPAAARAAQKRFVALFAGAPDARARVAPDRPRGRIALIRVTRRETAPGAGTAVFVHGGGFVFHDVETFLPLITRLAAETGRTIIAPDYPKAPECDPAALVAALVDAVEDAARAAAAAGRGPVRLIGDSVGAAVVLRAARDRLDAMAPPLDLINPMLDLDGTRPSASHAAYGTGHLLEAGHLDWFRELTAAGFGSGFRPLDFGPADFARLGPIALWSAACDPLADEAGAFAEAAGAAGHPVRRVVLPAVPHDFGLFAAAVPEAEAAVGVLCAGLRDGPAAARAPSAPAEEATP